VDRHAAADPAAPARLPAAAGRARLVRHDLGQVAAAAAWDVFGTANFLTFQPWTAAVEYLLGLGPDRVAARGQALEVLDRRTAPVDSR
jgi:hypothetical protein